MAEKIKTKFHLVTTNEEEFAKYTHKKQQRAHAPNTQKKQSVEEFLKEQGMDV